MRKKKSLIIGIIIFLSIVFGCIYFLGCNGDRTVKDINFEKQLGTYCLDLDKTSLGDYEKHKTLFKNLQITFKKDGTFYLNMKVPFIYDSSGEWKAGGIGLDEWNYLYYKSNLNINTQFTSPWTKDSIFYLNSVTPQKGEKEIPVIYFKKIFPSSQ
jgi:hypothetical protein